MTSRYQFAENHAAGTNIGSALRTSTAWADVDTTKDIVLERVQPDDLVVVTALVSGQPENYRLYLDAASYVSTGPTTTRWGGTDGQWMFKWNDYFTLPLRIEKVITAGDLVDGVLTVRWQYKVENAAGKSFAILNPRATNFGPQQT